MELSYHNPEKIFANLHIKASATDMRYFLRNKSSLAWYDK